MKKHGEKLDNDLNTTLQVRERLINRGKSLEWIQSAKKTSQKEQTRSDNMFFKNFFKKYDLKMV